MIETGGKGWHFIDRFYKDLRSSMAGILFGIDGLPYDRMFMQMFARSGISLSFINFCSFIVNIVEIF
jgi:hypothetical protein